MLDNDFIANILLPHKVQRVDIVREGFGRELVVKVKVRVLFGVEVYGRVERGGKC